MNFGTKHHIHLDPNTGDAGSGGGAPAGGAPAPAGGASATPSFDANAFKTEVTGMLRSEMSRFQRDLEGRFSRPAPEKESPEGRGDKEPSLNSYLNANGEMDADGFARYQRDMHRYFSRAERTEWEREHQQAQARQQSAASFRKAQNEHLGRESEYEKANPSYRQDLLAAGDLEVNPDVGRRIIASKYSAHIIHHFAKNQADFRTFQALSYDDPEAAIEMIGELAYGFKARETDVTTKRRAASAPPTTDGFGGGRPAGSPKKTKEQMYEEWNS